MRTTLIREGDRVWLDGVRGWFCGEKQSSVHACQEAIMRAVGEEISYDYLLGVSGLAFRMQVHKNTLCPSSPHSFCGFPCVARSTQALPWRVRIYQVKPDDTDAVLEARRAVARSIDQGVPVQYGSEEDGIAIGYLKDSLEWICYHPMRDGGRTAFIEKKWPWGVAIFTERREALPSRKVLAIEAIRQALEMSTVVEAEDYYVGYRAWECYLAQLEDLEKADDQARQAVMLGNAWIYECLAGYRGTAAGYLSTVAGEFHDDAAAHLTQAAQFYRRIAEEILSDDRKSTADIAPYPKGPESSKAWSAETRREQGERLKQALDLERKALGSLGNALAGMEA